MLLKRVCISDCISDSSLSPKWIPGYDGLKLTAAHCLRRTFSLTRQQVCSKSDATDSSPEGRHRRSTIISIVATKSQEVHAKAHSARQLLLHPSTTRLAYLKDTTAGSTALPSRIRELRAIVLWRSIRLGSSLTARRPSAIAWAGLPKRKLAWDLQAQELPSPGASTTAR